MSLSITSPKSPSAAVKAKRSSPPEDQNISRNAAGIWHLHCSYLPTKITLDKAHFSLSTQSVEVARARRDTLFNWLQARGALVQRTSRQRAVWVASAAELPWLEEICARKFPTLVGQPNVPVGQEKSPAESLRPTNSGKELPRP